MGAVWKVVCQIRPAGRMAAHSPFGRQASRPHGRSQSLRQTGQAAEWRNEGHLRTGQTDEWKNEGHLADRGKTDEWTRSGNKSV